LCAQVWGDDGRKRENRRMTCGPMAKGYITVSIPYPSSFLEPNKKTGITLSYNQIKN
jgi:hypothetical protein